MCSLASTVQPVKAAPESVTFLRIMPFGDSITSSVGVDWTNGGPQASYRYWLDHDLHSQLIPFEFMGTRIDNYAGAPKYLDFDRHNEGWSGYTTGFFLDSNPQHVHLDGLLSAKRYGTNEPNVPDIVLLHLGTNDVMQLVDTNTSIANLKAIIDKFRSFNPKVLIFLAKIIPCDAKINAPCSDIPNFNSAVIPTVASQKTTPNSPVIVVDQYTGFNGTLGKDTYDGVHPNQSGEIKMANKWLAAIQAYWDLFPHSYVFIPAVRG